MKEFITPCGIIINLKDTEKAPTITKPRKAGTQVIDYCPVQAVREGNMSAFSGICSCNHFVIDTANAEGDGISG